LTSFSNIILHHGVWSSNVEGLRVSVSVNVRLSR